MQVGLKFSAVANMKAGADMFGNHQNDLVAALRQMQQEALERAKFNHADARNQLVAMVKNDRRLDGYDPERFVDHVRECSESGRRLDWDDPSLKRGGQPRPQNRRGMW